LDDDFVEFFFSYREVAIALRQRLNETVEHYELLKRKHTELEVKFDTVTRELTIAKSDRKLLSFHLWHCISIYENTNLPF
jgi:hypothetical protein